MIGTYTILHNNMYEYIGITYAMIFDTNEVGTS